MSMSGGIVRTVGGWVLVGGLFIGSAAAISGDLNNADDIGGSVGDVGGAGIFGGIFGGDGMIAHAMDQRDKFANDNGTTNAVPKSKRPSNN